MHYFDSRNLTLFTWIQRELDSNPGAGFEATLVFVMTSLFQGISTLGSSFIFWEKPLWADLPAQIVARSASGTFENFTVHGFKAPLAGVVYYAETPADVQDWLEHGQAPWCRPKSSMGPDLLTRVKLDDDKVLLLVVQAKCHLSGNPSGTTITADKTADAIRSVTPRQFFPREVCKYSFS